MAARVMVALAALLLALPLVPAPNVPVDPNVTYLSALSVPISTPSQAQPDVKFTISVASGNPQYLFFDIPTTNNVNSIDVRVKAKGTSEYHIVVRQGTFGAHCDKPLLPSTSPYACNSTKVTSDEGHVVIPYPQTDRYFVTVILDSASNGGKSASFSVRTTLTSCPANMAGPDCAYTVMPLAHPVPTTLQDSVPANQYKYYTFTQQPANQLAFNFQKASGCADPEPVFLVRANAAPSLEPSTGFPYYDLSLTCEDVPQKLDLIAPVAGTYFVGVWGGAAGVNVTWGVNFTPCPTDFAGSSCESSDWWPPGSGVGPWCVNAGLDQCKEIEYSLPWDHNTTLNFSPFPPGWNYLALPTLPTGAYSFKITVVPSDLTIPFTIVAMRNNIPVIYPQYNTFPVEAWAYYNVSDSTTTATTILNVAYPAAGNWWVGILADPAFASNASFAISTSHYTCFQNCSTSAGTCQTDVTLCKCKSGHGGPGCAEKTGSKSHAGAIVGAIFGVLGGVGLIAVGVWYFFMRPKTSYEMI